jgi:aminopeptidase YwaD
MAYRRISRDAVAVLGAALAAFSTAPGQQPARDIPPEIQRFREIARRDFSGENARDVVAYMERWFRVPGNTGFDSSLTHVEGILRRAGYVEESQATPGSRLTYRVERRPLRTPAWDPIDAELTIVGRRAPLLRWKTNRNMLAINSWSTPDTGIVAEVVLVSPNASAADSAKVKGKIALMTGGVGRAFQQAVLKHGAVGVLSYGMPAYTQPEKHTTSIQFGNIPFDTLHLSWGISLSRGAWDALRAALRAGPVRVRVRTATRFIPSVQRTLVADVHGSERPDERFVLSAHVQEPGANDNASGVGALSEMARVLASNLQKGTLRPRRSITMIFGEEIAQTRNYLAADSARTAGVRWGMSLDMVGEDTKKTGGTFLIEKMPDPSAVWTRGDDRHTEWGGEALTLDQLHPHYYNDVVLDRCLDQADGTGWVVRTNPYEGGSDHVPFLQAGKAGVLLWHFTDVFYHTDNDRLDMVSAAELRNSGICALLTALTLTSADGVLARQLVAEVERDAIARLDRELALSREVVAREGERAAEGERKILRAWTDWYREAIGTMRDIEVGGSSPETVAAIESAARRVSEAGEARIAQLR